jgi:hypothetical protein
MKQTQYQKEAGLFFAMAAELRHAYREGGSIVEIAELVDEIDTFCRYTDYPALRERGAALLSQSRLMATGTAT